MPVLGSPTPPPQWYPPHHSTEGKGGTTPTRPTPGPHHRGRWGGTIGGGGGGDGRTGIIYTLLGSGLQLKSPMLLGLVPGCYPESFRECSGLLGSRASAARMASTSSGNTPPPVPPVWYELRALSTLERYIWYGYCTIQSPSTVKKWSSQTAQYHGADSRRYDLQSLLGALGLAGYTVNPRFVPTCSKP